MSCERLTGKSAADVRPLQWRRLGIAPAGNTPLPIAAGNQDERSMLQQRVASLEQSLEQQVQQARRQGRAEGEAAASRQAAQQLEQALTRITRSTQELLAAREQMRRQMEADLVRLSIVVARRILHRELSVDPEALAGVVRAALDKIEIRELHRLRIAAADAPALQPQFAALGLPARVELVPDSSLERGAVIFETVRGAFDASVDTQLAEVDRGFADLLRRRT